MLVERCGQLTPAHRQVPPSPGAPSIYSHVPFEQDTSFLIIGERTNANGSKKFRDAMLEGDWDTCVQMATEQVKEGAHVLDVCVDYVGRDGTLDMDELASRFATQVAAPLVLDSTEPQVLEAGLQWHRRPGHPQLGQPRGRRGAGSRFDRVFTLASEYGAAVICLLIDEEGQARDVEWKLRVAHRIHDLAVERYGLEPADLIFDALTFPLSTGDDDLRRDGMATIEAIRRIKDELPGRAHRPRRLQRVVRPQAGGPPRPQLGVPARVRRGRARLRHRPRGADHAAQPHPRRAARGRPRPRLRPRRARRPTATTRCRSCSTSSRT